jgi:hypothetical protein
MTGLHEFPLGAMLSAAAASWLFGASLWSRPARLEVGPAGARVRRIYRPWALTLPLEAIRRVDVNDRSVYLVRSDRSLLRSFLLASAMVPSVDEARWLAAELRRALRQAGWQPS